MSALEDLIEGLFHVGVMAVSYDVGRAAQKSLAGAIQRKDLLAILGSALVCGGSAFALQSSGRKLGHLLSKQRIALPKFYDLRQDKSGQNPFWYLPKKDV